MKLTYKTLNTLLGWITFVISAIVYLMTIEPTASFWDCGEFIASSSLLEVGHPPGAPLFMLVARLFTFLAGGNVSNFAIMINAMSALASAFTILFLFWTITHLAKKIISPNETPTKGDLIAILGSGFVGALAYTFSDSFWFSAVEGEVYASSSFFTAIVFWAILKWEEVADDKYALRWIILIAYLMGLSIGVHLLNLLSIPAIVFVVSFKKFPVTRKNILLTSLAAIAILGFVQYGIIPGTIKLATVFELLFVNGFGLPYNSGVIFYFITLVVLIVLGLKYTHKKGKVILNTAILSITFIIIGYCTYGVIIVRSNANPPMNQNAPKDVFSLLSYLNREQYGDRPLLFGPYYNAPIIDTQKESPYYMRKNGRYEIYNYKLNYVYDSRFMTFFPRMYSNDPSHIQVYKNWGGTGGGTMISTTNSKGETEMLEKPTFIQNLRFFLKYQVGFMYFRYFMWNFSGRQNDIQGYGGILNGNWQTGIKFLDNIIVGPQKNFPKSLANNKANNKYYLLPLLLGILGLLFQYNRNAKDFTVIMLFFFFTGLAIILYLNQTPLQPRERDYAYSGSFYVFAIWIGLGLLSIYSLLQKYSSPVLASTIATIVCFFCVPYIMANENWDDHDRSRRYTARDIAFDYLNSCAPNSILFTNGDNDTFPLWYAQEVEKVRQDVRVVCLPYLSIDWYIEQMQRKVYQSEPLPISMTYDKYISGKRDIVYLIENQNMKDPVELKQAMEFVASDDPRTRLPNNPDINYIPTKRFKITIDSAAVVSSGTVKHKDAHKIVRTIEFTINKNYIMKNDLMILEMIANNNWKRPIYFVKLSPSNALSGLQNYLQIDGFAYRLVPIRSNPSGAEQGRIDADELYDKLMNKFKWGNLEDTTCYWDENNQRTTKILGIRTKFALLASELIKINKNDSAIKALDYCLKILPFGSVGPDAYCINMINAYYLLNKPDKANYILNELYKDIEDQLKYYSSVGNVYFGSIAEDFEMQIAILSELVKMTENYKQTEQTKKLQALFDAYYPIFASLKGNDAY